MLVKKIWLQRRKGGLGEWRREGWYLFGWFPLYIRDVSERGRSVR